ncbi:hypothetical protein J8L97_15035 [Pseudoalteromonas sp. MMG012]|nr:hypothetical protein [Pseudoalteromonas sp. MMG012]
MKMELENTGVSKAKEALALIEATEQRLETLVRFPIWLILLCSISYGLFTFAYANMAHDNEWALAAMMFFAVFLAAGYFGINYLKRKGIKLLMLPRSTLGGVYFIGLGVTFGVIITLSRVYFLEGVMWSAYVGSVTNMMLMAVAQYCYPLNEVSVTRGCNESD